MLYGQGWGATKQKYLIKVPYICFFFNETMKLFSVVAYHDQRQQQVLSSYARKFLKMLFFSFIDSVPPKPQSQPLPPTPRDHAHWEMNLGSLQRVSDTITTTISVIWTSVECKQTKVPYKILHLFCLFYESNEAFYSCCLP